MAKKLVKRGSEVTSNSDAICKVTGLRHCDDSTKKEIVDYLVKIDKQNDIPECYIVNNSNSSTSSVRRVFSCVWDGSTSIPDFTTLFNISACVLKKAKIVVALPGLLCAVVCLLLKDSAKVKCRAIKRHHLVMDIELFEDKIISVEDWEEMKKEEAEKNKTDKNKTDRKKTNKKK